MRVGRRTSLPYCRCDTFSVFNERSSTDALSNYRPLCPWLARVYGCRSPHSPAASHAQTVGYWRFESGAFLDDSSGNGHNLTTNTGPATQVSIPANFPTQVPPTTGPTNTMAADIPGSGLLAAPDDDAWTSSAFTVEAFIKPDAVGTSTSVLVGNFDSQTGDPLDRGWFMGINNGNLRLLAQGAGSDGGFIRDRFKAITAGNEYYVACSFATGPGGIGSVGTMYLQDLTAGGPLRTATYFIDTPAGWEVPNNSSSPLSIGSTGSGTSNLGRRY